MFLTVPDEEPQGPQFKKFPQSRTVDEGSPFKATCALDDVETGKNNKISNYGSFISKFVRDCSVDRFVWNTSPACRHHCSRALTKPMLHSTWFWLNQHVFRWGPSDSDIFSERSHDF